MKLPQGMVWAMLLATCGGAVLADDRWDYPDAGRRGVNLVSAGRAGQIRVFDCETTDPVEQVVQWYAARLGIDSDHTLRTAAADGFAQLKTDLRLNYGIGRDTADKQDHTQVVAHITAKHAHVTFVHRPSLKQGANITVSISQTPAGASVHVVEPLTGSAGNE